jgi:uncharacterized membrane protein
MLRDHLFAKPIFSDKFFRWRGGEVSRLEGFSDAVFGFALTLLVVSLEVPQTLDELLTAMRGFMAFAVCFMFLSWIWYEHYLYFRRYGLQDALTISLNALLLFLILFYIYPLKFLFTALFNEIPFFNSGGPTLANSQPGQTTTLMVIYSLGFFLIFLTFFLLHVHAYRKRAELEFDEIEVVQTHGRLRANLIAMTTASLSMGITLFGGPQAAGVAGMIYGLMGPAYAVNGFVVGKRVEQLTKATPDAYVGESR